ncbi:MAG TPA: tetratricopeptide repeat protein [Candidatus Baltobacteraceae bacterium]|nr:tetratricopeptide repeat protein [Candidatus Baltobacteraceae bacterium]
MPISQPQRPPDTSPAAIEANRRGVFLHSQGELAQAADAFRAGIAAQPEVALLHVNLATVLVESGELDAAQHEYETALGFDPELCAALAGLGSLHVRMGRFAQGRQCYERVLRNAPDDMAAHLAMYEIEQIDGNIPQALRHQRHVLERKSLFTQYAPHEKRRLLVLLVPGDWQANVPVDFLVDSQTTTVHKLYLLSPEQIAGAAIPQADVVFTAIAESDENAPWLALAADLVRRTGLPSINDPLSILAGSRENVARKLAAIAHLHMPATSRLARETLETGTLGMDFPIVVRPVGSQAGRDLARIGNPPELAQYLQRVPAQAFYVMPFVDYRSPDGYYRKYRIIVVDGVPYAHHLAISPQWMIHYYNAPMRETAWMREEEAFYLAHFERVFEEPLRAALSEIAKVMGLDYVGVDCSIDPQGRLLVFEADPAMVVHAGDDPELFGYKNSHARLIFAAFQKLIDRVRSR